MGARGRGGPPGNTGREDAPEPEPEAPEYRKEDWEVDTEQTTDEQYAPLPSGRVAPLGSRATPTTNASLRSAVAPLRGGEAKGKKKGQSCNAKKIATPVVVKTALNERKSREAVSDVISDGRFRDQSTVGECIRSVIDMDVLEISSSLVRDDVLSMDPEITTSGREALFSGNR